MGTHWDPTAQSADEEVPWAFRNCGAEGLVNFYWPFSPPDCMSFPWQPEPTSGPHPLIKSLICHHDATNVLSGRGMTIFVDIWVSSVIRSPVAPSDARTVLDALSYLNTLPELMLIKMSDDVWRITRPQWVNIENKGAISKLPISSSNFNSLNIQNDNG